MGGLCSWTFSSFLFHHFFWQVVCTWAVLAAQDGIGLLQYDSPSAIAGLTDLAGVQRRASGVAGCRPAGFTGGGSLHPAKYVPSPIGDGTKQPRTPQGLRGREEGFSGTTGRGEQWDDERKEKASSAPKSVQSPQQ